MAVQRVQFDRQADCVFVYCIHAHNKHSAAFGCDPAEENSCSI